MAKDDKSNCRCNDCDPLQHGDIVLVSLPGWIGQIVDFRQQGFNDPEYQVRVWTGNILFKEWFTECELDREPDPVEGGGGNVIPVDFTRRVRLEDAEPQGAA